MHECRRTEGRGETEVEGEKEEYNESSKGKTGRDEINRTGGRR